MLDLPPMPVNLDLDVGQVHIGKVSRDSFAGSYGAFDIEYGPEKVIARYNASKKIVVSVTYSTTFATPLGRQNDQRITTSLGIKF
jgi:hypothetical protein